jgi:cytochrome b
MARADQLIAPIRSAATGLVAALMERPAGPAVRVWDGAIRSFHWLLVAAVLVAGVTGFLGGMTRVGLHLIAGIAIVALVGFRVVWGLFGPTYARFRSFIFAPRTIIAHLRELRAGEVHRHLGHNPLGALMVFALLVVLLVIVLAGVVALGGMFKQGPLGAVTSFALGWQWLGVHRALAWLLLVMVGVHLAGVAFETWRTRENLVAAMVTGVKSADPPAVALPARRARPIVAGVIVLGLTGGVTWCAVRLAEVPARLPPTSLDPTYAEQCGACHVVFSPSLNPAAVWDAILANLQHHFGNDASLDAAQVAQIRAYLDANSAEHWDTLPANLLRVRDPGDPLRMTATPYWRHIHAGIPARVFASPAVGAKYACDACHRDAATGRFAPQRIDVPAAAR